MLVDNYSIVVTIPALILTQSASQFGFTLIQQHVRTRLTLSTSFTRSDPRSCAYCYGILINLASNLKDKQLILNQGLVVYDGAKGRLFLREKSDSALLELVDDRQMMKYPCFSQNMSCGIIF